MNKKWILMKTLYGSFSFKARLSKQIDIPLTRSGRQRKLGAFIEKLILRLLGLK